MLSAMQILRLAQAVEVRATRSAEEEARVRHGAATLEERDDRIAEKLAEIERQAA